MIPTLHLLPTPLVERAFDAVVTPRSSEVLQLVTLVVAEHPRTARRVLPGLGYAHPLQSLEVLQYDEHSTSADIATIVEAIKRQEHTALLSEAGVPCIADPGARLVRACHHSGIRIIPHGAGSALVLALMASGLNGQRFSFNGYLPVESEQRDNAITELERRSVREQSSELFIETPYRTAKLFEALCRSLNPSTELCVAQNLTSRTDEQIRTQRIAEWKKSPQRVLDVPTIFILAAARSKTP